MTGETIHDILLAQIAPNPFQPRRRFDQAEMDSLTASVKRHGVHQPIILRPNPQFPAPDGSRRYQLVAGERRLRACVAAGKASVPGIVRTLSDLKAVELSLSENLDRDNLNAIEVAISYQLLLEQGLKQAEIAQRLGRNPSTISNALRLLQLPPVVQDLVMDGVLPPAHGVALAGLAPWPKLCASEARLVVRTNLSQKELQQRINGLKRKLEGAHGKRAATHEAAPAATTGQTGQTTGAVGRQAPTPSGDDDEISPLIGTVVDCWIAPEDLQKLLDQPHRNGTALMLHVSLIPADEAERLARVHVTPAKCDTALAAKLRSQLF